MFSEYLIWFLLPVAATAGWVAARKSAGNKAAGFWDYSQNFHEQLNQLLSADEADGRLFDNFSQGDRDAADTHIALGNLYRRRGEFARAIRIHESIIGRADLDAEVRDAARFELATDYDAAGLLDRAELAFRELLDSNWRQDSAYDALLQLYERERDWVQAIDLALQCKRRTGKDRTHQVAHYYCELAESAVRDCNESGPAEAHRLLELALQHWPGCARAHVQLAGIAMSAGRFADAINHYDRVEALNPTLVPVIIESRFAALKRAGNQDALTQYIHSIRSQKNAYTVIRTTRAVIAELVDEQTADRFFKDQILKRPSLRGLRDWTHDQLLLSKPDEREKVQIICDMLDQVMEDKPAYRCRSCGFQGNTMHWRCPGCGRWDSVSMIVGVEGE